MSRPIRFSLRLATHFDETWQFDEGNAEAGVIARRRFALYPRHWWARPALWLIRPMLKAAVKRHTETLSTRPEIVSRQKDGSS